MLRLKFQNQSIRELPEDRYTKWILDFRSEAFIPIIYGFPLEIKQLSSLSARRGHHPSRMATIMAVKVCFLAFSGSICLCMHVGFDHRQLDCWFHIDSYSESELFVGKWSRSWLIWKNVGVFFTLRFGQCEFASWFWFQYYFAVEFIA